MKEQILKLYSMGLTPIEISKELHCSKSTVKHHTDFEYREKRKAQARERHALKKAGISTARPKSIKNNIGRPIDKPVLKANKEKKKEVKKYIRLYDTKPLNLDVKVKLVVDEKTTLYIRPDKNPELVKQKYLADQKLKFKKLAK